MQQALPSSAAGDLATTVDAFLSTLRDQLSCRETTTEGTILISIVGLGQWRIDLAASDPQAMIVRQEVDGDATSRTDDDVSIRIVAADLEALLAKRLSPMTAMAQGKLKLSGDLVCLSPDIPASIPMPTHSCPTSLPPPFLRPPHHFATHRSSGVAPGAQGCMARAKQRSDRSGRPWRLGARRRCGRRRRPWRVHPSRARRPGKLARTPPMARRQGALAGATHLLPSVRDQRPADAAAEHARVGIASAASSAQGSARAPREHSPPLTPLLRARAARPRRAACVSLAGGGGGGGGGREARRWRARVEWGQVESSGVEARRGQSSRGRAAQMGTQRVDRGARRWEE